MGENVWFEQVDKALISFIQNNIQVNGSPVKVIVRSPDKDFYEETYPVVSLYNLYDRFSPMRYSQDDVPVSRDYANKTITLEKSAIPYDLTYQIDFWSDKQSDINSMKMQWNTVAYNWFNLPVKDDSGNDRSSLVKSKHQGGKSDHFEDGKRLYHSFETYTIQVELDPNIQSTVPMVTGTSPTPTEDPEAYLSALIIDVSKEE